jgi:hypothetical protein
MLAVMGAWFQAEYTGTGPIDNLFAHLADPGHATIFRVRSTYYTQACPLSRSYVLALICVSFQAFAPK